MAFVAVASVVKEKVVEMMKKESALTFGKVIMEDIKREVEIGESLLITTGHEVEEDEEWGREFRRIVYELEDLVETTHSVGITRRRRKLMMMMMMMMRSYLNPNNNNLSLNNFLIARRKMKLIATQLKSHNKMKKKRTPSRVLKPSRLYLTSNSDEEGSQKCSSMKIYEADDSEEEEEQQLQLKLKLKLTHRDEEDHSDSHGDGDGDANDGDSEFVGHQSSGKKMRLQMECGNGCSCTWSIYGYGA